MSSSAPARAPWYRSLYLQVLVAIALGVALGHFMPQLGEQMRPLGDGFIKLIKMVIAPITFCTVVDAFAKSDILQVLMFSVLGGIARAHSAPSCTSSATSRKSC